MNQHAQHHHDVEALLEQAVDRLRAVGERITPARRDLLAVLASSAAHLSADEVVSRLSESGQTATAHRTTAYRNLERFAEAGVVVHQRLPGGAAGYHLATESHLHGHCTRCRSVVALEGEELQALAPVRERLKDVSGFDVDLHRSTLYGVCRQCRAQQPEQ